MANSCVFMPKNPKRAALFKELKSNFGYDTASKVYNRVVGDEFINAYKDSLTLSEGVPTYASVMSIPVVQKFVGDAKMLKALNSKQLHLPDTLDNTAFLVNKAREFNTDAQHKSYVAIVDYDDNGDLTLKVEKRDKDNVAIADNQYKIQKLNEKVAEILTPMGINMAVLSREEVAAGRVGLTDFNHAADIASGFEGLIRVANNLEGNMAISEEFSHFIIGVYRNNPLVQRSINLLTSEIEARAVLGDEFDDVYNYYDGDMELVAEEAAGHVLKQALLNRNNAPSKPLFRRMVDFIVNLFKGVNPGYYADAIDAVTKDMSSIADSILSNKTTITKQDVVKAKRDATFNALSEKEKKQVEVLKGIVERSFKSAALQKNLVERAEKETIQMKSMKLAESINTTFNANVTKEETMAAIAAYIDQAGGDIDNLLKDLSNIETLSTRDRFIVLSNILWKLKAYAPTIRELKSITSQEYLSDEGVKTQNFMVEDVSNSLKEFETDDDVEPVDTTGMSAKDIADKIVKDSEDWELSDDETYYVHKNTSERGMRVTKVIAADKEGESFDPENPWVTPSTNIGTGMDELVRDFLSGRVVETTDGKFNVGGETLDKVYPNATNKSLQEFCKDLKKFKEKEAAKGITLISRNVVANGTVETVDGTGNVHKVRVTGTIDLLGYDKDGNWYLYDMKTHRGAIDEAKKAKYERQVTLYKKFLEQKYGIKIKQLGIIPIKVTYPAPKGTKGGTKEYTVQDTKPSLYNGTHPNQLEINGEPFLGANPTLEDTIEISSRDLDLKYSKLAEDPTNGLGNGMAATIAALDSLDREFTKLDDRFNDIVVPQFVEFLKPFIGENIEIREMDKNGRFTGKMKVVSVREVVEQSSSDVTLAQRWLTSMADNPDAMLQIFDFVVKKKKDEKRRNVINMSQEILALGKEFEDKGITSYDWMFEEDKKSYIRHLVIKGRDYSYDSAAFNKAMAENRKRLDAKYGEHPEIGSEEYKKKKEEDRKWINDNTESIRDADGNYRNIPLHTKYPSKYNSLNSTQKEFYDRWMQLKAELDVLLGPGKTDLTDTIKIRKSGIERAASVLKGGAISEFIEKVKSATKRSFDDDVSYKDVRSIGFNNEEIMKLSLYYVNKNAETKDLSTDAIGTLIAYADMAYNYAAMNEVVDPLEMGRHIAMSRKITKTRGDRRLYEEFSFAGKTVRNPLYEDVSASNFRKTLDDFFESKVYNRYLKDNGEVGGVDVNKASSLLLKLGSTVQLGFNVLAGFANLATGLAMHNIEAAASEHFDAKTLAKADKEFMKAMPAFTADIGQRIRTSKLALFDEMFDVRQNFSGNIKHKDFLNKWILSRVFGPSIQYICQDAGDHWLYNRSAIAIALNYKLKDSHGKTISLWDALETVPLDPAHPERGKKLKLKNGVKKTDGTEFTTRDMSNISGKMRYVNQHCFGIYNQEDSIGARRTIVGRFLMQYRDWIPAQFRYRFGAMTTNLEKGGKVEGYYRTSAKFIRDIYRELKNGEKTIPQLWRQLDDFQKANIKRTITELAQYGVLLIVWSLLKGGDDKDKTWAEKMLKYTVTREKTELGALIPLSMPNEMLQIMKSPFANTNVISDIYNLTTVFNPWSYSEELKSGDYKGHSKAYRAFMRSPLTLYYRTLRRTLDPAKAESFYDKD